MPASARRWMRRASRSTASSAARDWRPNRGGGGVPPPMRGCGGGPPGAAGVSAADVEIVLATHLHFDHAGGFTVASGGAVRPAFPRARYVVSDGEWEDATHPHERNRASYLPENFVPLADAGAIDFTRGDDTVMPGVRVRRTGGHT